MKGFEEFWKESERNPEEKDDSCRGWNTAYEDFQETAEIRFAKGVGPFCNGYNACMHVLRDELESIIEDPLELHIYQMIRACEDNLSRLKAATPLASEFFELDLQAYKLALKQHLSKS